MSADMPLQEKPDQDTGANAHAIAITGMSCVFPGAPGIEAFWALLEREACAVGPVPPDRWDVARLPASAAPFAGFIDDAACFDPAFFGISPKEAAALDPRQRLTLQLAWWALEDAGIAADSLKESRLGVFIGAVNGEFLGSFAHVDDVEAHMGIGSSNAVLANRISHILGLRGPSMSIDTACSSSLVAVHQACRALQAGDADMVLAGGVSLMLRPDSSVALGAGNMLAPDGLCKTFDAAANGYGRGEGAGLVLLKRLDDAFRDGDRIHAIIRGSASNHDGVSNGITAPNGLSQESLINAAIRDAGLPPSAIQYVEAHGTGTLLGDPTETRALGRTLGQQARPTPLLIGSVKTNIGHLEAAAGIAGLIKLVLALKHQKLPASLHYRQANPHINFEQLNLQVVAKTRDWPANPVLKGRLGSVSAFGFGGSNCHVVVQEYSATKPQKQAGGTASDILLLSASSKDALQRLAEQGAAKFAQHPDSDFSAICALSRQGRAQLRYRLAVVADSLTEVQTRLRAYLDQGFDGQVTTALAARRPPKLGFVCPGQGSQRPGMARDLFRFAGFRATVAVADSILPWSLSELLQTADERMDLTAYTQPALLALGVGLARTLADHGIKPQVLAGHSLGEYTAAVIAGALSFEQALRLVERRGRLMGALQTDGAMAAVRTDEQTIQAYLHPAVSIAAVNGPQSLTISGAREQVEKISKKLEADGIRVRPLRVQTAFHSALLEPMLVEFEQALNDVQWQPLQIPVCSNLTGELLPAGHVYDTAYWLQHTRQAVRFADNVALLKAAGVDTVLELGAVPVLSGMLEGNGVDIRSLPCLLPNMADRCAFLHCLGSLHVIGARLQFPHSDAAAGDMLPLYPFAKDVFPLRLGLNSFELTATRSINQSLPARTATVVTRVAVHDQAAIRQRIIAIVASLLATDVTKVDASAPLLEIGADSLILMQAVGRIENEFAVKIPVRAFFENLSTIEAVAAYLHERQPALTEVIADGWKPTEQATKSAVLPAASSVIVRPKNNAAPGANLTEQQRLHLAQFSNMYCSRTARSKQQAQQYRHVLADSRASAGFRFSIKEMLYPIVGQRAAGSRIWDIDGNEYIDISMGFGVQLFGHEPEFLQAAIAESLSRGIRIGPQSDMAGEVAELISELTGVERVAFCSSGTEAIMTSLRLARTFTGRNRIAIFRDSYHGHFDGVLGEVNDDPFAAIPRVAGITPGMVAELAFFEYGSATSLEQLRGRLHEFAAVLVEPVQSRNPGLQPQDFLHKLRAMTRAAGSLLIFDEVLVGFRIHPGGAQAHFDVQADIVTYGKIVGGGLPIGVIAGRADIMAGIDGGQWQYGDASFPAADTTFFAGTFNKHPLVMAAAHAVLSEIKRGGPAVYQKLNDNTARLTAELDQVFRAAGAPVQMKNFGSLFRFVFSENLDPFFYQLLYRGLYVWEGRNLFLSTAHTVEDIAAIVERVRDSVDALKQSGFITPSSKVGAEKLLPLSKAQRQLATLATLSEQGSAAYVLSVALDLRGKVNPQEISTAFSQLVQRHDALRASIDLEAGVQQIAVHVPVHLRRRQVKAGELDAALQHSVGEPFDLTMPGAFRLDLFELAEDHAVLLLAVHHVFMDGQSLQMLFEEFAALLRGESLSAMPDYDLLAQRMAEVGSTPAEQTHKHYWLQKLKDAPAGIELPFAHARPGMRSFAGQRLIHALDAKCLRLLEQKANRLGMSSTMALISAFAASLRRAGAGQDMVIGVPYSGRDEALAHTPGYCAHLLPLRLSIPARAHTGEVLAQVKQEFLDAIGHANYPLSQLVDDLGIARDPARPPLVNITFNVDRLATLPDLPGMDVQAYSLPVSHARFDIACNIIDWHDGARIEFDFDTALFDTESMQDLLDSFVAMLSRMAGTDQPCDERHGLFDRWLPVQTPLSTPDLLSRFRQAVAEDGQSVAVRLDATDSMTRRQLDAWSDQLAQHIHDKTQGSETAGPVCLLLERSLAIPVAMLAAWKSGKAYLPLDHSLPQGRLLELIRQAQPCCVLLQDGAAGREQHLELCKAIEDMGIVCLQMPIRPAPSDGSPAIPLPALHHEDCAYQLFTSGSTGKPKLVAVPHRAVQHYLDGVIAAFDLQKGLRYGVVSTFAADLGLTAVLPALFHSGCLTIVSHELARDADAYAVLMQQTPLDVLKIVPSHLEALLSTQVYQQALPRTHLILGGETASPQLLQKLRDSQAQCRIFNHFGPTEATIGVMVGEWQGDLSGMRFKQPLGNNRVHILDAAGHVCAPGETGEIYLGGPGLALGYAGMASEAASPFIIKETSDGTERLYRTGDLAVMHADGSMQILGRKDEQLKIRGYRIEPAEIIAALMEQDNIAAATVLLHKPGNSARPCLLAYVVAADKNRALDADSLLNNLRRYLPDYMLPRAVLEIAALPYTANGKLDRAALPILPDDEASDDAGEAAGANEALVLDIWRALLQNDRLGTQADFFQAGGDSILAIQMMARLRQAGWVARAVDLFSSPVLADFARKLTPVGFASGSTARPQGACLLLPAQIRLHEKMQGLPAHYNLSVLLAVADWVNADMLEQALQALLVQHDVLRLRFSSADDACSADFIDSPDQTILQTGVDQASLQASLDPAQGRLMAAGWTVAQAGQPGQLLLIVHHLVSDGISMHILLEDLRSGLLALQAGREPGLPAKTASVQAWADRLQRQARQDALLNEAEYWEVCTSIPPPELPVSVQAETIATIADEAQVVVRLDAAASQRFAQGGEAVTAEDILIAALTLTLADWTGEAVAYVELEGHGRQPEQGELDASRTVGWFTSRYPAWFDLSDIAYPDAARAIAAQRHDIPAHGMGYGLLRYLGPEQVRARLTQGQMPEISLNFMGQIRPPPADAFSLLSWSPERSDRGPERALHLPRLHKIAIEAFIMEEQLNLLWQYDGRSYTQYEMSALAQKMQMHILAMLADGKLEEAEYGKEEVI